MIKEQSGPSFLRFQVCHTLDVSSVVPAAATTLIRGLHPKCVCFHPSKPLMAVGVSGYMAVYDMQTNTRLGRVDLKSVPVEMAFAPDGSVIIVVVQDWILYSVSTTSWKARQLVPRRTRMDRPLERCLLAVAPGHHPFIYFCRYAKDTIRLATLPTRAGVGAIDHGSGTTSTTAAGPGGAAAAAAAAGGGADHQPRTGRGSGWGTRVKLDVQKAVLGLACHHVDAQLLVLGADGQLRGYAIAGAGGHVLAPLFAVQVQDPADRAVPPPGILSCVPHPGLPTGAIILQGSQRGAIAVLEAPGRTPPIVLFRDRVPGHCATIGMGVCRAHDTLLVFGLNEGGRVRCSSWRLMSRPGSSGLTMRPSRVDPQDITPLLDLGRRTKVALAGAVTSAGALAAANGLGSGRGWGGGGLLPAAASIGGGGPAAATATATTASSAAASAAAAAAIVSSTCYGLWGLSPSWSVDVSSSCLLEPQLGPPLGRVLVHPGLGLLALVPDPPRAALMSREVMFAGRGGLSGEEAALARRTSTLVLMTVLNLEAPAGAWRGARLAPQHTPLTAWLPPGHQHTTMNNNDKNKIKNNKPQQAAAATTAAAADGSSDDEAAALPATAAADTAGVDGGGLALPPHVYYLAGSRLMKYALVTRNACTLATLPADAATPDGDLRTARQLVHSSRAGAWLVFFEAGVAGAVAAAAPPPVPPSGGGAAAAAAPPPDRFSWTLLNATSFSAEGGAGCVTWVRQGKSGCFLGPDDSHFCVLSSNGKLLELFETAAMSGATAAGSPLLTLTLEGASLLPGLGSTVFPGPPMTNSPVLDARAPPDAPPHDARRFRGAGVVLWQSADQALNMTTLPALQRVPLDAPSVVATAAAAAAGGGGDSSDSDFDGAAAPAAFPSMPIGHFFGPQHRQAHLPLLPQETVVHVAWQSLVLGPAAAAADAVAAVLTTQRLLLVTGGLRVVCSVSLATHGSTVLQEPLTSVLWAGPMLLASTISGQVLQVTWTGTLLPVATMSPTGHLALLGVTADSLLVLRTPLAAPPPVAAGGGGAAAPAAALAEVVPRPAALLQPLLIAWASLAATGLLSYGSGGGVTAVVRPALRHVLASYDATSFTPRGVWALIAAGAWDVAAVVAAHMPLLDGAVRLAAAAAAGEWSEVSSTLLAEASRALHAPAPPPRGSELHSKLVAGGAGALLHGQLATAGALFQAAGEWPAAMILAVCQGNSQGLTAITHKLSQPAGPANPHLQTGEVQLAQQLASALRNVYGGVGTPVGDAPLTLNCPGSRPGACDPLDRAQCWTLAPPLASPAAVAVALGLPRAAVPDTELGAIPPCTDRGTVVSYYGLTATAAASVTAAASAAGAGAAGFSFGGGGGGGGRPSAAAAAAAATSVTGSSSHRPGDNTALGDLDAHSVGSSDAAQAAARAEFLNQFGGGGGGFGRRPTLEFSSDDDDSGSEAAGSGADMLGGGGGGGGTQRRIKLQIRDPGGGGGGGASAGSLREAVGNIRVVAPGAAAAASRLSAVSTIRSPPPPPGTAPAAAAAALQLPAGMSSAQLYAGGAVRMEGGDWHGAAAHFSRAMAVLQHEERGTLDEQARAARLAFCAQYYAAVRLLEAVGGGAGPREARLYRYLGGLTLDPKHSNALIREAIVRNRTVGNYKYAADNLTALIVKVADSAPAEYLAQLQAEIEECDRHGVGNAGLSPDERVADWASLVAKAGGGPGGCKEEVDELVLPLIGS